MHLTVSYPNSTNRCWTGVQVCVRVDAKIINKPIIPHEFSGKKRIEFGTLKNAGEKKRNKTMCIGIQHSAKYFVRNYGIWANCVRAAWRQMKCVFIFTCWILYFGSVFYFSDFLLQTTFWDYYFIHSLMFIHARRATPKHLQCHFSYLFLSSFLFIPLLLPTNEPTKNKTPIRIYSSFLRSYCI